MDNWERYDENLLPDEKEFYSSLNMEDIMNADYSNVERVYKEFKRKILGEYHDFYFQRDILLLANIFENFSNLSLNI